MNYLFIFATLEYNLIREINLPSIIDIFWDKRLIVYYELKDNVIINLRVKNFNLFYDNLLYYAITNALSTGIISADTIKTKSKEGLLSDIELPINLPTPIAGIIGQGGKLDISGGQKIEIGGSRTQNLDRPKTELFRESWFPTLEMKQQLQVNLKGTVGEKIHVFIDHNSEREFNLKNTIRLEYKGDEDEIIQSIRAGNTDLSLPGMRLIGGATPHKGLFGIKSEWKLGAIKGTTIASREEAETEKRTWKGGGIREREMKIPNINFVRQRFFIIVPPRYVKSLRDPQNILSGDKSLLPKKILSFKVYVDRVEIDTEDKGELGTAFDILNVGYQEHKEEGKFVEELPGEDEFFTLDTTNLSSTFKFPILQLNYSLQNRDLLAIHWIYEDWNGNIDTIGLIDTTADTVFKDLQIIKRARTEGPSDTSFVSWWYELKNIYAIGATDTAQPNINIKIFKYNYGGGEDSEIDPKTKKTYRQLLGLEIEGRQIDIFDERRGLIIFPQLFPFADSLGGSPPDSIYHIPKYPIDFQPKYYILVKYRGTTREYSLDMINIIPGSEKVSINGIEMQKGRDYEIDYDLGWIRFKNPLADDPNARIEVDFQYVPFFQAQAKNLIGTQIEKRIGESGEFSSALLYYSTSTLDFRPRLGSEPKRIILGEVVGGYSIEPEIFTNFVDKIPFIETDAPSKLSFQYNAAFSLPNLNTRNEVYLDDMEGAKSSFCLGISRMDWFFGSVPYGKDTSNFAQIQWYNPREGIPVGDLYPSSPEHERKKRKDFLRLYLPPNDVWRYPKSSPYWISLNTCISKEGIDFSESEYLEVWLRGGVGKLHIDVGIDIPEDAARRDIFGNIRGLNNKIDTEDKKPNNRLDKDENEDTGLDGILAKDGTSSLDDGNDDYHYDHNNPDDYSKINGTENDGFLNTEDLDRDGTLNKKNNYFSFEIDLEKDVPTIENDNGWKFYRIPLTKAKRVGNPQWECIKYARLWVENINKGDKIDIAALNIVGNKWRHTGAPQVKIETKNTHENPEYSPPPIELEMDAYGRKEKEQCIVIKYNNLQPNTQGGCYTQYTTARNFMQYKSIKFWIRGKGGAKFFIRIGGNVRNYYEYKVAIPNDWKEIIIDLEKLSQLKIGRKTDTSTVISENYKVCGNPSLTNILRLEFGVINEENVVLDEGEVWINELRLGDVRRDAGVASNISSSIGLADFANINLSYRINNPYFMSLGNFIGGQNLPSNSSRSVGISGDIKLDKIFPEEWGFSIPLSWGFSNSKSIPKYQTGSDIILKKEEAEKQSTYSTGRNIGISLAKTGSQNKLMRLTLDNIKTNFSYRDNFSNTYTRIDTTINYSCNVGYAYSPALPPIKIRDIQIRYFPSKIGANATYSYSYGRGYRRLDTTYSRTDSTAVRGLNYGYDISYNLINPLTMSYSTSRTRDLNLPRKNREIGMNERLGVSFSPSLLGIVSPTISYHSGYNEEYRLVIDTLHKNVRNVSVSNELSYKLPVNLSKMVSIFTGIRDESTDSLAKIGTVHWFLMNIEKVTERLHTPNLSYSIGKSTQFYGLTDRPDYKYRWGIEKYPENYSPHPNNAHQTTKNYGISGIGISIANISVSTGYRKRISEGGRYGNERISIYTEFPSISLDISEIEKILFPNLFTSINFSSNFSHTIDKSGTHFTTIDRKTESNVFDFSVYTRFKKGVGMRMGANFDNKIEDKLVTPRYIVESKNSTYSVDVSYAFSAPEGLKLPLLSHIKLRSNLNTSLTIKYSTNYSEAVRTKTKIRDSRSLAITPQLSYNFSATVTGGINFSYVQNWNNVGMGDTRTVGLRFFADFRF